MTDWMSIVSYAISGAMLVMMAIGIALSVFIPALERWNKRYFITLFSILLLYAVVLFIDVIYYYHPEIATAQRAITILEYLFFSVLTVMPMPYFLHYGDDSRKNSILFRAVTMLWVIFFLVLIFGQFTDVFYFTAPDGQYNRGTWFPMMMIPLTAIMILNLVALFTIRKRISKKVFVAFLVYLIPTAAFVIAYMFVAVDTLVSFWMALCALTMFGIILTDNMEQYVRQQREIANQRADIMVLQMRPHFIYNTMMSIYYLCDQDPKKAKQVTMDFTTYLRKNFTAIASEEMIPFTEELEHTRAYLAVEQAQYEDRLYVSFETPHTFFRIPPLTLQPLVENAVKHGMDPNGKPLNIRVISHKTPMGSEVIVEDDGPGFKPTDGSEQHGALNSIRQRLEMMCKGSIEITPREGGGTSVKLTIPVPEI